MAQESQKLRDPAHIWDEVNEATKTLLIVDYAHNHAHLKMLTTNLIKFTSGPKKLNQEPVAVINLRDFPPNSLRDLRGLPENLSNLISFKIRSVKFQSIEGFPKYVPNLEFFEIRNSEISSLESLPQELPALKSFIIEKCPITSLKGIPISLQNLEKVIIRRMPLLSLKNFTEFLPKLQELVIYHSNLTSLQYFPKSLPNLEKLEIEGSNLSSLRYFPQNLPNLQSLSISKLSTLKGMPSKFQNLKKLSVYGNLTSLEYLPEFVGPRGCSLRFNPKPLRTLSGIKNRKLFNQIAFYRHQDEFINLHPKGLKLIKEHHIAESGYTESGFVNLSPWKRVEAKNDELVKYYAKTQLELAQQYITDQKSLTEDKLERLAWEAGHEERQLLESNLPSDDPIIKDINARFSVEINNGFDIKL